MHVVSAPHLMVVMHSRHDLSEEVSRLSLAELATLAYVIVQLSLARILHYNHNLVLVLKHCNGRKIH